MNHDLRIGLRCKKQSCVVLCMAQRLVVLHDTVANQGKGIATNMGMGVGLRNPAVGSPPGVAEAGPTAQRAAGQYIFERIDPSDGPGSLELSRMLNHCDTRRVVSPVLKTA